MKLYESDKTFAFLDINPLVRCPSVPSSLRTNPINNTYQSHGHALVIPKYHGEKLTDIPDEHLAELLPIASRIAKAAGAENFNILQNNGRIAHQVVDHVHVHMIPKPNEQEGLGVGWPMKEGNKAELAKLQEELKAKM